jgi:serine/threonine protein kinase
MSESARENQANLGQDGRTNRPLHADEPSTIQQPCSPEVLPPSEAGSSANPAGSVQPAAGAGIAPPTGANASGSAPDQHPQSQSSAGEEVAVSLSVSDDAPTIISGPPPAEDGGREGATGTGSSVNRSPATVNIRGRRLAHFELEEPIGVGGMAAVIRARDTQLDRVVALKILPPQSAADPDQVRRFEREARAAARLDHENIARVYYCGEDQGLHFIAFEYVEGENLRDMIARRGRIPVPEATQYVLQVARGLAHAAERGVVHRDIKPSNIIVTASGVVKLIDMGLARTLEPSAAELTQSGATLGTFDYISPEQALDPRLADTRSDIYSLGCTFYHMLTGRPPTPEGTAARKLHFHQNERPVDPRYYNPEIPRELVLILGRMLAKEPHKRYQHPQELVEDLQTVLQEWSQNHRRTASRPALQRLSGQKYRGSFAWLAALAVICGVAVASWLESHRSPIPDESGSGNPSELSTPDNQAQGPLFPNPSAVVTTPPAGTGPNDSGTAVVQEPVIKEVKDASELRDAIADTDRTNKWSQLRLNADSYELHQLQAVEGAWLRLGRGQVTLEPAGDRRPTLVLDLTASELPEQALAVWQLHGGIVTLRRVRLLLRLPSAQAQVAMFQVLQGQLELHDCEIEVEGSSGDDSASVFLVAGNNDRPRKISLYRSVLVSSVSLFRLASPAQISLEHCGLGPAPTPVVFQASQTMPEPSVSTFGEEVASANSPAASESEKKRGVTGEFSLQHCTWWLASGPAMLFYGGPAWNVHLRRCILAQVSGEQPAVMLEWRRLESQRREEKLDLQLQRCALYRIEPFVVRRSETFGLPLGGTAGETLLPQLRSWRADPVSLSEEQCVLLKAPPWNDAPPELKPGTGDWLKAFQIRTDVVELRDADDPQIVLGVQKLLGRELYEELAPAQTSLNKLSARHLVVDGKGGKPDTFDSLSSALNSAAAESGNIIITLRVNGPLMVRSLLDVVGNRQVTVRSADGFTPELMFHPERIPESNQMVSLFRVHDGQLVLEGLHLRLQPLPTSGVRWQAAVNLTGAGSCQVRNCRVTLAGFEGEPNLALVAVTDPTGTMAPTPGKPSRSDDPPQVFLEDCFIRGSGVGIYIQESRPLRFAVHNVLAALQAPFLRMDTQRTEMLAFNEQIVGTLDHVTLCSTEPVVHLQAVKENAQPLLLRWQITSSLLVTVSATEPLVRIDGPQSELELRRNWLSWTGQSDKPNVFSLAGPALLWQTRQPQTMMTRLPPDRAEWCNFWGTSSDEVRFLREFRWQGFRAGERDFKEVEASEFQPDPATLPAELRGVGADITRLPGGRTSATTP